MRTFFGPGAVEKFLALYMISRIYHCARGPAAATAGSKHYRPGEQVDWATAGDMFRANAAR